MTKKYKDFVEYLNKEHKEVFVAALYSKTKEEIYRIIQTLRKIDFRKLSYVSSEVKKVTAYYTDDDHLSFDAVVGFVINTIVVINDVRKETLIGFKATFTMDGILKDGLHELTVIDIQPGEVQRDDENLLTKEFIPYISSDELDKYAEAFLMEYYPDALFDQVGVNINEVIKNMDINYLQAPLRKNIYGMTIFGDTKLNVYNDDNEVINSDVKCGTIIANPDEAFTKYPGVYNNTLIHECVHWWLHRKYFELQKILNPDIFESYISCNVFDANIQKSAIKKNAKKWMEWQANNIAPHILVPTRTARDYIYEQYELMQKEYKNYSKAEIVKKVIEAVSDHYGVSHTVAKIRAIQLGFDLAKGVYNCIDGNWCEPYSFPDGILNKNQTYQIGREALVELLCNNPLLMDAYSKNKIIYVDGFLVINNPNLFIRIGQVKWLRSDVLEDVSKYCFCFNISSSVQEPSDNDEVIYLCKASGCNFEEVKCDLSKDENRYVLLEAEKNANEHEEDINHSVEVANEYAEIMRSLPMTFGGTLKKHIDRKGYTQEDLEEQCILTRKTISDYINNPDANPEFGSILALAIGLNLAPIFTIDLLEKAKKLPVLYRAENWIIFDLVTHHADKNIHYWNEILKKAHIDRLPKEKIAKNYYENY